MSALERRNLQRLIVVESTTMPPALHALAINVEAYLRDKASAWGLINIGPDAIRFHVKCRYRGRVAAAIQELAKLTQADGTPLLLWDEEREIGYFPGTALASPPRTLAVYLTRKRYADQLPECPPKAQCLAELAPYETRLREEETARRDEATKRKAEQDAATKRQQRLPGTNVRNLVGKVGAGMDARPAPNTFDPLVDLVRELLPQCHVPLTIAPLSKTGTALVAAWSKARGNTAAWRLYLTRVAEQLDDDGCLHLGGDPVSVTLDVLLQAAVHEAVMSRTRPAQREPVD